MESHLLFSKHLTSARTDRQIVETYLGMAHFAGTGPEGKTCRECVFWYPLGFDSNWELTERRDYQYRSRNDEAHPRELHDARCNKPMLNKAERCFPHFAAACRMFEPDPSPPLANKLPKPKKPKRAKAKKSRESA